MRPPQTLNLKECLQEFPVVSLTAAAAIAVTAWWWSGGDVDLLTTNALVFQGEPWRAITAIFPHVNLIHLLFNLYWLWVFGTVVERDFGHLAMAVFVVIVGGISSLAEYAVFKGGVGLSGVGYGLFGMLWVLSKRDPRYQYILTPQIMQLFVGWFFLCIVLTYADVMRVANIAHGMGAVMGGLVGWMAAAHAQERRLAATSTGACCVLVLLAATWGQPYLKLDGRASDHEMLAMRAFDQEDFNQAAYHFSQAVASQPDNARLWYNLGVAYSRLGDLPSTADAYTRAYELEPLEAKYRTVAADTKAKLAHRAFEQKEFARAADLFRQSVELEDTRAGRWYMLGLCYGQLGQTDKAQAAFQSARELDPTVEE